MAPIDDALAALESQEPPNYSATAKQFGISRTVLSRRHRGINVSREEAAENKRLLSTQQEQELVKYINKLSAQGLPPTNAMVRNFAREIAKKEPSHNWVFRFVQTYSTELKSDYLDGLDLNRRKADNRWRYERYFKRVCVSLTS